MKDIPSLRKKLTAYSAISAGLIAIASKKADAQIVYTNINPDTVSTVNNLVHYHLDLNNDGIYDFKIYSQSTYNSYYGGYNSFAVNAYGLNSNSIIGYDVPFNGLFYASVLNEGDIISQNQPWLNGGSAFQPDLLAGTSSFLRGLWIGATDKFLGLKFYLNGNSYYGWARLDVYHSNGMLFTLKDYAYQSIPDSSILAGATEIPTHISSPASDFFSVLVNDHHLILHFHQSPLPLRIILFNSVGVKLSEQAITQQEVVIDVSHLTAGIYLVAVDDARKRQVKKVVIR